MEASDIAVWLEIAAPIVAVLGALWRYERKLTRRLDKQDADSEHMKQMLDKQFGGNSGGIREAINGIDTRLDDLSQRVDRHLEYHVKGDDRPWH